MGEGSCFEVNGEAVFPGQPSGDETQGRRRCIEIGLFHHVVEVCAEELSDTVKGT